MGKQFMADFLLQVMNDNNCSSPLLSFSLRLSPCDSYLLPSVHYSTPLWVNTVRKQRRQARNRKREVLGEELWLERGMMKEEIYSGESGSVKEGWTEMEMEAPVECSLNNLLQIHHLEQPCLQKNIDIRHLCKTLDYDQWQLFC